MEEQGMILSPKEKAEQLVSLHSITILSEMGNKLTINEVKAIAKQCALITLKEMQEVYASVASAIPQLNETKKYRSTYLDEVKQEIEKL